jgi:hypothetical protein
MDGVRGAKPTVLQTSSYGGSSSSAFHTASSGSLHGVLLVVAQGGHRIAYHFPGVSSGSDLHGFDRQILADLLLPKPALYDRLFDLTVGERRLIGWPVRLEDQHLQTVNPWLCSLGAQGRKEAVLSSGEKEGGEQAGLRALSVVFVLDAQPLAGEEAQYARVLSGCQSAAFQLVHALVREEVCGRLVSAHVEAAAAPTSAFDDNGCSMFDDGIANGSAGASCGSSNAMHSVPGDPIAAMAPPNGAHVHAHVHAHAHVGGVQSPGPSATWSGGGSSGFSAMATWSASQPEADPASGQQASDAEAWQFGELGAVLRAALLALREDQPVMLRVGAYTDVAICAPEPPPPPPKLAAASGGMPPPPPLRPYLALLPLEDPARIAKELPTDASPLLMRLVHAANPLRSLEQLADETGIPMPKIFALSTHLQQWNKVRIIHPLTQDSVLCVQPDAPRAPPASYRRLYGNSGESEQIPPYHILLALFAPAQRFGSVIRAAEQIHLPKRRLVQITITLLQCDVLRPLLTYVHCVEEPPKPARPAAASSDGRAAQSEPHRTTATVYADEGDGQYAIRMARWRLFRRLRPMLYGEHHLEEIMWQERLSRDVLEELLKAYDRYLLSVATFEVDVGRLGGRGYSVGPSEELPTMR